MTSLSLVGAPRVDRRFRRSYPACSRVTFHFCNNNAADATEPGGHLQGGRQWCRHWALSCGLKSGKLASASCSCQHGWPKIPTLYFLKRASQQHIFLIVAPFERCTSRRPLVAAAQWHLNCATAAATCVLPSAANRANMGQPFVAAVRAWFRGTMARSQFIHLHSFISISGMRIGESFAGNDSHPRSIRCSRRTEMRPVVVVVGRNQTGRRTCGRQLGGLTCLRARRAARGLRTGRRRCKASTTNSRSQPATEASLNNARGRDSS